jgi:molybdopterin molybdotransferase
MMNKQNLATTYNPYLKQKGNTMNDCYNVPNLMPFELAKSTLLTNVNTITENELIAIQDADQRILAKPVTSPIQVPAHNNSAMDGYAIRDDSLQADLTESPTPLSQFKLIGTSMAGSPYKNKLGGNELNNGECIRIMTGAVVPNSANAVVMQENVNSQINPETQDQQITLLHPTKHQANIRFAGEDIQQGHVLFDTGYCLKAVDIGLLSSLGLSKIDVFRKLKVAVLSTGDELKMPGQPLQEGDIYESNSQILIAMLQRLNMSVIPLGIIKDDKTAITNAFIKANREADVVISSGGVSVGDADYTKEVLSEIGTVDFWKVAIKPGKPFAFGKLDNSVFFGLPGNPVSAAVTFHQLAVPALRYMAGANATANTQLNATTTSKINKKAGRMDFQRGVMSVSEQGNLQVTPLPAQGSGILSSISRANCYIILAQENQGHQAGDIVTIELFDSIISS